MGGVATVIVDGPLPTVYQQHLRDVFVHVISLGGRVDLRPVATLGDIEGVGALPDRWSQSDRLEGVRHYQLAAVAATQIDVFADDNDVYVVELLEGGRSLATVRVPRSFGGGLRWRALEFPLEAAGRPIDEIEVSAEAAMGRTRCGGSCWPVNGIWDAINAVLDERITNAAVDPTTATVRRPIGACRRPDRRRARSSPRPGRS